MWTAVVRLARASLFPGIKARGSCLLDLLYPPHCVACGRGGEWLCAACREQVAPPRPLLIQTVGGAQGGVSEPALRGIASAALHRFPLRDAIHGLKYDGMRVLADPLGDLLAECWRSTGIAVDALVPVPLHRKRLRYRGYNQALLLANAMSARAGMPVVARELVRCRETRSQVGLSPEQRRHNVHDAFACCSHALAGQRVLLIDDVCTTGATLGACARALTATGASAVWALTITRAASDLNP
jgi:ComF family protein